MLDLKKQLKDLFSPPSRDVAFVDVPVMPFLMIDGQGDPNTAAAYREAVEALYAISYTLKFMPEASTADYAVMPLEGLWWADGEVDFENREGWRWTMMIAQPAFVTDDAARAAIAEAKQKKALAAFDQLRFETFTEGTAAQTLYVGPFTGERPTIERIHAAILERGGRLTGKHHEIYLSNPRRTSPERLKTIIRQPYS